MKILEFGLMSWAIFGVATFSAVLLIVWVHDVIEQKFLAGFLSVGVALGLLLVASSLVRVLW